MKTSRSLFGAAVAAGVLVPALAFACMPADLSGTDPVTVTQSSGRRDWGTEQATGKPNTPEAGDMVTAWASLTPDDQKEWLLLTYRKAVQGKEILVYETYNPGALTRVTVFNGSKEVEVWKGKDPVVAQDGKGIATIPVNVAFAFSKVKLYIDSPAVAGWNEIDAVEVKDAAGKSHWASRARASSTYAVPAPLN
jgi:hypothetical protein